MISAANDGLVNDTTYYISIDHTMLAYNDATNLMPSSTTFTVEPFVVNQMLMILKLQETDASWSSWGGAGFQN